jgi:hypothetical protein
VEESYGYYVDLMPQVPYASPQEVRAVLQFLALKQPKAVTAKPEEFYEMGYLKKIEDSGFVKSLDGRR